MIDYILFGLTSLSFIFTFLSVFFIWKEKEFEEDRLKKSLNSLLAGICFLSIFLLAKAVGYGLDLFTKTNINNYIPFVELISISLMVIFFLVGMMVMSEVS